jgi:hypothetical protein
VQIKAKESVKTIAPYDELPREGGQATDGEDRPTLECGARDQRLTPVTIATSPKRKNH